MPLYDHRLRTTSNIASYSSQMQSTVSGAQQLYITNTLCDVHHEPHSEEKILKTFAAAFARKILLTN